MRVELLYNPSLVLERIGSGIGRRRRMRRLRGTIAGRLEQGHLNCLELFELTRAQSPSVIYDIGANVGTSALLIKALFPRAEVHSFEPLAKHCTTFRSNVGNLKGVTLHQVGLGNMKGGVEMQVASFSDASSLLPVNDMTVNKEGRPSGESEHVQIVSLDEYVEQSRISHPDVLKIDVQGYELEVLRGALRCLQSARGLIIEVSFVQLYERQCLFHEIVAFCAALGFYVKAFAHGTTLGEQVAQTDVLFLKDASGQQQ